MEGKLVDEVLIEPRGRRRIVRQKESLLGNIGEALGTYLTPNWYAIGILWLTCWSPDAVTAEDTVWKLGTFIVLSAATCILFAVGAMVGVEARFSSKPLRLFAAIIGIVVVIILTPILVGVAQANGTSVTALDWAIVVFGMVFGVVFTAIAYIMHTAVRRVEEYTGEN